MKAFLECVPCVLNQIIKILQKRPMSQKKRETILQDILARLSKIPASSVTPPDMTHEAYEVLRKHLGRQDYFKQEKEESNIEALRLVPKTVKTLHQALLYAIAGNIIDYGPDHKFDINKTIKKVLKKKLAPKHLNALKKRLKGPKKLLYICDNAGEIVFDKLLIEFLIKDYKLQITVAVKSKPVLNDAQIDDAKFIKLDKIVDVIESGSITAGTNLKKTNSKFNEIYEEADIIFSKGQGNFETLPHNEKTFFLLMVKCFHLAQATHLEYGEVVLWSKSS